MPVGREVLCLPLQKLYLPLQNWPWSHKVKNLHLPGHRAVGTSCFGLGFSLCKSNPLGIKRSRGSGKGKNR